MSSIKIVVVVVLVVDHCLRQGTSQIITNISCIINELINRDRNILSMKYLY